MKNTFQFLFIFLIGFTVLSSCKKDKDGPSSKDEATVVEDNFDAVTHWDNGTSSDKLSSAAVQNGHYIITSKKDDTAKAWYSDYFPFASAPDKAAIQIDVKYVEGGELSTAALLWDAQYTDQGNYIDIYFDIAQNGQFRVSRYNASTTKSDVLSDWANSATIKKDDWNTLRIEKSGNSYSFFINSTKVKTLDIPDGGMFQYPAAAVYADGATTYWFDNFKVSTFK